MEGLVGRVVTIEDFVAGAETEDPRAEPGAGGF